MIWVPGGTFAMGSNDHYPEEAPVHPVTVDGFWMDATPVTNRQFMEFVSQTGYVTEAEQAPSAEKYPGASPAMLRAGSLVFVPPKAAVAPDIQDWWTFKFGADWRRPYGSISNLRGKLEHPVVHVTFRDASAYAQWARLDLPTEAEWEFACRAGSSTEFPWGAELMPNGKPMANIWAGTFPHGNSKPKGRDRTSPVGSYLPNRLGLYDMIGNVWEWTVDYWSAVHSKPAEHACCIPKNPRGGELQQSYDPQHLEIEIPRRVMKGGSHLCASSYCRRYRAAARHPQAEETSTSHIGFRCIKRC